MAAACRGLDRIFEQQLPETQSLIDSFSTWKHIKPFEDHSSSSFTEIFGELHFKERHVSFCTEGLGFESFDDVEDSLKHGGCNKEWQKQDSGSTKQSRVSDQRRSRTSQGEFPPPISCIGRNGKPLICFKSYRDNGRFILKETKIPAQELLHAYRENGRLRLQFVQSDVDDEHEHEEEAENCDDQEDDDHQIE